MKIGQPGVLATIVIAFAALAAPVLTGQAGIRQDLRAIQTDLLAGQAAPSPANGSLPMTPMTGDDH